MSHPNNKIWIHAIWSTKRRMPLIHQNVKYKIYQYISEQLREQGCLVRIINVWSFYTYTHIGDQWKQWVILYLLAWRKIR